MSTNKQKPTIKYEDFQKIDIRAGTIINCEDIEGSDKLLKLEVDFGDLGKRQILAGIKEWFEPKELIGVQTTFIINLEPRKMMGLESQGMLLAIDFGDKDQTALLQPDKEVPNGARVI
jgi:methionyl-tRNA synthetase